MTDHQTDGANVLRLRPAHIEAPSTVVAADTDVRTLMRGGGDIEHPIMFTSDKWDTRGHADWTTKVGRQTTLDFNRVPQPWRTAAKEWVLLTLDPYVALRWDGGDPIAEAWPDIQEPVKLSTAQGNLKQLGLALSVLASHGLTEPTTDDWARIAILMRQPQNRAEKIAGAQLAAGTLRGRAQQLNSLWLARSILNRPRLLGDEPFDGQDTTVLFGSGSRPKTNRRRPHEDVGLCLGYVAWVFDNIADDVLAHARWWADNQLKAGDRPTTQDEGYQAMTELLADILARTGKLPGTRNNSGRTTLAASALGHLLGTDDPDEAYLWGRYAMRRFDPADLDETGTPCPLPISAVPLVNGGGTTPWAPRLLDNMSELVFWRSALVYYAMFYISATCGLRDKDLTCLPLDCIRRERKTLATGEPYEVITMRGYKTKNRLAPQAASWKVSERIARIVEVVQELHRILQTPAVRNSQTGELLLFNAQLGFFRSREAQRDTIHLDLTYMDWLIKGADRLHRAGVTPTNLSGVTKLNSSQIRITALQAYASRPLGNALAAQFGQWSNQSVAMGYHSDVYKIVHLADPEDAMDLQHEHIGRVLKRAADNVDDLRGKGIPRLNQTIARNESTLSNPAPLTPARFRTMGKKNSNIALGPHTICIFQSDGALCGGQGSADFRLCRPFECRNSVMTPAHRAQSELRRRVDARTHPALQRSAAKIAAAMPEVVAEFADTSDDELVRIVAAELDDYVTEALGLA